MTDIVLLESKVIMHQYIYVYITFFNHTWLINNSVVLAYFLFAKASLVIQDNTNIAIAWKRLMYSCCLTLELVWLKSIPSI